MAIVGVITVGMSIRTQEEYRSEYMATERELATMEVQDWERKSLEGTAARAFKQRERLTTWGMLIGFGLIVSGGFLWYFRQKMEDEEFDRKYWKDYRAEQQRRNAGPVRALPLASPLGRPPKAEESEEGPPPPSETNARKP